MRCELEKCRAQLVEHIDRLGRVRWFCAQCERRKRGICRTCNKKVEGKVGVAYYCGPCKKLKRRAYVMKWQRNNLKKVAQNARRRRWAEKGEKMPVSPMTYAERGKLGGKLGAAARVKSLGSERVKEIAARAVRIRWERYRAAKANAERAA
jgi:hypothetical protein